MSTEISGNTHQGIPSIQVPGRVSCVGISGSQARTQVCGDAAGGLVAADVFGSLSAVCDVNRSCSRVGSSPVAQGLCHPAFEPFHWEFTSSACFVWQGPNGNALSFGSGQPWIRLVPDATRLITERREVNFDRLNGLPEAGSLPEVNFGCCQTEARR